MACVIGLGLVGQLVVRLLVAAGVRVVGIDTVEERCRLAEAAGAVSCASPDDEGAAYIEQVIRTATGGLGADHVFLAAGGDTNGPVELAARLARDRARVVDIGKTRLDLPWNAYYEKELDVRFSRSYGPGRYDDRYELDGIDYPAGYVRWTERRNLGCFLDLLAGGSVDVGTLVSATRPIEDAAAVYEDLRNGSLRGVGFLFEYPDGRARRGRRAGSRLGAVAAPCRRSPAGRAARRRPPCGWASSARAATRPRCCCHTSRSTPGPRSSRVATTRSLSAVNAQRKFGFESITTDADEVLADPAIDAVFVVTRHHSHAAFVCRALEHGKAVFVEKPLALTRAEVDGILDVVERTGNDRIMVGFNRRFAPLLVGMRRRFGTAGAPVTRALPRQRRADGGRQLVPRRAARRVAGSSARVATSSTPSGGGSVHDPVEVSATGTPEGGGLQATLRYRRRLPGHDHLLHRRRPSRSQGDLRRLRWRSQRPARQLRPRDGLDGRSPRHQAAPTPGRTRASERSSRPSSTRSGSGPPCRSACDVARRDDARDDRGRREPRLGPAGGSVSRPARWYVQTAPADVPAGGALRGSVTGRDRFGGPGGRCGPGRAVPPLPGLLPARSFRSPLPPGVRAQVPPEARRRAVAAADGLLAGDWEVLGTPRPDVVDPDWFRDPVTGRRAPDSALAFRIDHRDEAVTGNVKSVWELSRHHHLTVLAAAWWLTGDDRYAERGRRPAALLVGRQPVPLRHPLDERDRARRAAHELGVGPPPARRLAGRRTSCSRRTRRPWPRSGGTRSTWRRSAAGAPRRTTTWSPRRWGCSPRRAPSRGSPRARCGAQRPAESWNVGCGRTPSRAVVNRELATDYHRFVTELGLVGLVEAEAAGHPLGEETLGLLARSLDAAAAVLDAAGRPPRQGDGDEGRALVLDEPDADPWAVLLACGAEHRRRVLLVADRRRRASRVRCSGRSRSRRRG